MNELLPYLLRLFVTTFPYWLLSYYPFWNHLRFSRKFTLLATLAAELLMLAGIGTMVSHDVPASTAEFIFIPVCIIIDLVFIKIRPPIIFFFYLFIMDYQLMLKGIAYSLLELIFGSTDIFSQTAFFLQVALFLMTVPLIFLFLRKTAVRMLNVNAPKLWRIFWLIPALVSLIVLIFTSQQTPDSIGYFPYLAARVALLFCVFITYYILLLSLDELQRQTVLKQKAETNEQLMVLQKRQYNMIRKQIDEFRSARHDLRQHIRLLQFYLEDDNREALESYIDSYMEHMPANSFSIYCSNSAVNAILNYYIKEAQDAGIDTVVSVSGLPEQLFVSDTDFCVLLGNLLENAIAAEKDCKESDKPFIKVHAAAKGEQTLLLTVDNGPSAPPVFQQDSLLSGKHDGKGIGTQSVKNIAESYNGSADFTWTNGMFFASVLLRSKW